MNFTFFYDGPFSQWYHSPFRADGNQFCTAEQYMMVKKACLFHDEETAQKIMATSSPRKQKALGRTVKNFDLKVWEQARYDIVLRGNEAKFRQNPDLYSQLMATKGTLVEASREDSIWGIGLSETEAKQVSPEKWPGLNLLGKALTEVRDNMRPVCCVCEEPKNIVREGDEFFCTFHALGEYW
jgi:hypothetical protein